MRLATDKLKDTLNDDPEFLLCARSWDARLRYRMGDDSFIVVIRDGRVAAINEPAGFFDESGIEIEAGDDVWRSILAEVPPPRFQDLFPAQLHHGLRMHGDLETLFAYYAAVRRMTEVMRAVHNDAPSRSRAEGTHMATHSPIRGGYVYLPVQGLEYRVYYEEAGSGIPLILMHTAGTDGRLYRHMLEDPDMTRDFRIIAVDLPYHGKSLPPLEQEWWKQEYRLTTSFLFDFMLGMNDALELDRPVYMGASMGGHLAVDLAISHPESYRAVIGLEAGLDTAETAPSRLLEWMFHPRIGNEMKAALMLTMMSPTSPESFRREVGFVYSQGAPAVFKGDLNYYGAEHDVRETAKTIDTGKCALYILGGEYDWSGTPEVCRALHEAVAGSTYTEMKGLGHFPMTEDPEAFKAYILPVLDDIRTRLS